MSEEMTPAERALAQLDQWDRRIEAMPAGDQALIAIARGTFERFLGEHGEHGKIAMQLVMLTQVINAADPTILQ